MSKPALNVKDFPAVVMTMDWVAMPDGRIYKGVVGQVSLLSDQEAVGWEARGHNTANWLARIAGPTSSVNLMGCQVRTVCEGEPLYQMAVGNADIFTVP